MLILASTAVIATEQDEIPKLMIGLQKSEGDQAIFPSFSTSAAFTSNASSFIRFFHYPIEPPADYLTMDEVEPAPLPTAYYRDVYVGVEAELSVLGPVASETWRVDWLKPDGTTLQSTVQFFSSYNGKQNCFVGSSQIACGGTTTRIYWYTAARCQPIGNYTVSFFDNDVQYDQREFKLLPQIQDGKVPRYDQTQYSDQYDHLTNSWLVPVAISKKGCALTSLAMILSYHGITNSDGTPIKPDALNKLLNDNGGYTFLGGSIIWDSISKITNGMVKFSGNITYENLERSICDYGPQMVGAEGTAHSPNSHFMVTTGLNADNHFMLNDPWQDPSGTWYGQSTGWTPSNSARGFVGPEVSITDPGGSVTIYLHSPAELLVTDPQGRRLGTDPRTGQSYKEIPKSYYELFGLADLETGEIDPPMKELRFETPINGEYALDVIGTGSGTYALEIHAFDVDHNDSASLVDKVPITPNEQHHYTFSFSGASGVALELNANFKGSAQNTKVNSLLSYNAPTQSQNKLPAGTTSYTVSIFYSGKIIPTTFHAELNGVDVSPSFHPIPGTNERITLPLAVGRSLLQLSVDGIIGSKASTDSDRLTFVVP